MTTQELEMRGRLVAALFEAMGGWADYQSSRTPVVEAVRHAIETYGANVPAPVVAELRRRFAPWEVH
jgi:hypothetical protein